jgi:hypothetical protein
MDKYFVSVGLVVLESEDKKALENEGSDKVLDSVGGTGEGIPFM